jgi:hypothetical protein
MKRALLIAAGLLVFASLFLLPVAGNAGLPEPPLPPLPPLLLPPPPPPVVVVPGRQSDTQEGRRGKKHKKHRDEHEDRHGKSRHHGRGHGGDD